MSGKTVRVAAAVLRDGQGRILATERGYGPWKDWWEFPGGKIEAGESGEEALRREIREEMSAGIRVGRKLAQVEYDYPEFHLSMGCWLCALESGYTLNEHENAKWLGKDELRSVRWLPADLQVVDLLEKMTDPPV